MSADNWQDRRAEAFVDASTAACAGRDEEDEDVNTTELSLGDLADLYREVWDAQDEAQKVADEHSKRRNDLKYELLRRMEAQGMENYSTSRITLSVKEEIVPQVKDWQAVLPWIAAGGRWELVRKQLNSAPFKEMISNGEALPEGLEAVTVKNLNNRRK